jgi:hypothetical protein
MASALLRDTPGVPPLYSPSSATTFTLFQKSEEQVPFVQLLANSLLKMPEMHPNGTFAGANA